MPSKAFAAKWPSQCATCGQKIKQGDMIRFARPGGKDVVHDPECPGSHAAAGNAPAPPPGPAPSGPVGDAAIYTYHRRVTTGPGVNDWAEWGISTRGRTISQIDQESVDNLIGSTVRQRDQWGRLTGASK